MKNVIEIQQENVEVLLKLIKDNPDLPIIPMVATEIVADDCCGYWGGSWGKAEIDSYCIHNERFIYLSDGVEEIYSELYHHIYPNELTEEEDMKYMTDKVMELDWIKAIFVKIELPD
jgi:hypothetical protein